MFNQKRREARTAAIEALAVSLTTKSSEVAALAQSTRKAYDDYMHARGRADGMTELWQRLQSELHHEDISDTGRDAVLEALEWLVEDAQQKVDAARVEWMRLADQQIARTCEYTALTEG